VQKNQNKIKQILNKPISSCSLRQYFLQISIAKKEGNYENGKRACEIGKL
jgi:hypothetical protein